MFDLLREISQTLRNNRLRTVLTGISVAWGIFMLIVLLGAARGMRAGFEAESSKQSFNIISVWGGFTNQPYKGYKSGRFIQLKDDDLEPLKSENRDVVEDVIAYASKSDENIYTATDHVSGGFEAVYPDAITNGPATMSAGRYINQRDIDEGRRSMVLDSKSAQRLFKSDTAAVGQTVKCMNLAWTVVGVYTHPWKSQAAVPYTTYKAITGNNHNAYQLDVTIKNVVTEQDGEAAEKQLRETLARQHQFSPGDNNAVWMWNKFKSYIQNSQGTRYMNFAVWAIGLLTLLTGIVGVSNIMFVSVRERTHEIGIRRAIGAKPRSVLIQILAESVAVTTLFGYIGIVAGTIVLQVISTAFKEMEYVRADMTIAVEVTVALIICGCLAGLFPALKAIKVKPVEALRDE